MKRGNLSCQPAQSVWVDYASLFSEEDAGFFRVPFAGDAIVAHLLGVERLTKRVANTAFLELLWKESRNYNMVLVVVPSVADYRNDAPSIFGDVLFFEDYYEAISAISHSESVRCMYTTNPVLAGYVNVRLFGVMD